MTFAEALKSWWVNILLYGISLGLLLASLQLSRYRFLTLGNLDEWQIGLVALLFTVVGIWAGQKWHRKKAPAIISETAFRPQKEVLEQTGITPRELEVLEQMAQGLSNQEIAAKLFVSLNTVKTHASNVFSKLDAQRRTQAIQRAKELGLIG